jgi:hypothetical protein
MSEPRERWAARPAPREFSREVLTTRRGLLGLMPVRGAVRRPRNAAVLARLG